MKRKGILELAPKKFREDLVAYIDDLESQVNSIQALMDIDGLSTLSQLEDAKNELDHLAEVLY